MSARGLASGLVQPIARGLVRSAPGGGAPAWDGLANIVGMWPFDETSGPAIDASGNHNATAFNSPGYEATGGPGGIACRTSSGATEYFRATGITDIAAGDFTIVEWQYWAPITQAYDYEMASSGFEIALGQVSDALGRRFVATDSPAGVNYARAGGAWHCTIMRVQRSTKLSEVFLDGALAQTITMAADITPITDMYFMYAPGLTSDTCKLARCAITRYRFTDADVAAFSTSARDWAYWQAYSP